MLMQGPIIDDSDSMRTKHMRVFTTKEGDGYYALLFEELTRQNYNDVMESFLKFLSSCKFQ
jgi:hypothetical protein